MALTGGLAAVSACDGPERDAGAARGKTNAALRAQLMVVSPEPGKIIVSDRISLARAERYAETLDRETVLRRPGVRRVRADALAWLSGSAEGKRFLSLAAPRAIVRGEPEQSCPAAAVAAGAGGGAEARVAVLNQAVTDCLADLAALGLEDCGCKIVAVNDILAVPRSEMAYATGVTARVRAPGLGFDGVLIAEEEPDGGTLLRDIARPIARIDRTSPDRVRLTLTSSAESYDGRREPVGYRRGRIAERLYFDDVGGAPASLLIGFSPAELAGGAAAGLAFK